MGARLDRMLAFYWVKSSISLRENNDFAA